MKNNYLHSLTLSLSFALLVYHSPIISQNLPQKTISGTITDADGPLIGVNVLVKNTSRGTISDLDGSFSLTATASDTLVFTYLGYKPQEVVVGSNNIISIDMTPDATALDQVIINAGYYKVSDRERTGSIAHVTAAEIENQPVSNPLASMQGRMAGVDIRQTTGLPGGGFEVRIRGQNSIAAGNEPLYVIDGVPFNSQTMSSGDVTGGILPGANLSPLSFLNPGDIESIEVLKDADATSIYGTRGANGVVLITTKRGRKGDVAFSVKATSGLGQVSRMQELMNTQQYLEMRREAFANDGITEYPAWENDVNGNWDPERYTDWQKELIGGTAYLNTVQASVSGGGEQTQFLLSGGYHHESTVFPGDSDFEKASIQSNVNHNSKDNGFRLQINTLFTTEHNHLPPGDLTFQALTLAPNAPALYDEEGMLNWAGGTFNNPLSNLAGRVETARNTLLANTVLEYRLLKELFLKANLGYQESRLEESRVMPSTIYDPAWGLDSSFSALTKGDGRQDSWIVEPQVNWAVEIGKGKMEVLAGATLRQENSEQLTIFGQGFPSNSLINNLGAANYIEVFNDEETIYKYRALFGRVNYNYSEKYVINFTGRRDGSSRFGPGNKFANFGAVGAAWIFSEERFFKEGMPILNYGKLRGSYGSTGNDRIGDYRYLDTYVVSGNQYSGSTGLAPTQLYNPDFGWEVSKKGEVALELGLWKRVNLIANYYSNRSSNQLVSLPLPGTTGFGFVQANLGAEVANSGWEFTLKTINVKQGKFRWESALNLTFPKNKLLSFPGIENSTYANQLVIGEPLTIKKLYHYLGVHPETGIYQFEDYDQDGIISAPADQKAIADTEPQFYGGFFNNLRLGNLSLDIFLQFSRQQGFNQWYGGSPPGTMVNQPLAALEQWQQPGDTESIQLYTSGSNPEAVTAFYKYSNSTATISDASYIRLKNVAISYRIEEIGMKNMATRIFVEGQNLLTWTKFEGGDPEQLLFALPPLRWLTCGVEFIF